ncbi:MAG: FtsX-like permease family protein [Cyclobacteriaceae bacterium]
MLKFLVRLALRNLKKQRTFLLINVTCLSIGLLAFFLNIIYLKHELSFDRFHEKSDRIFRLIASRDGKAGAFVPYRWGDALKEEWAEVENLATIQNITIALTVKQGDEVYAQHGFIGADSSFFDIFNFPVLQGEQSQFLKNPSQMIITPKTAKKYFGDQDPIGKTLEVSLWGNYVTFEIQGVVECPNNSHLQFQFVIPIHFVKKYFFSQTAFGSWTTRFAYTYILMNSLKVYDQPERVKVYLKDFLESHMDKKNSDRYDPDLQSLEEIYLASDLAFDFPPRGSIENVAILTIVGLAILLMSIINFVNLTSAQHLRRIKEVGLKKILGSSKTQLISQLLIESILISIVSLLLVSLFIIILLPVFNSLTGKELTLISAFDSGTILILVSSAILIGLVSGLYPAILITRIGQSNNLSSKLKSKRGSRRIRTFLVTAQFITSILLLIGTGVVFQQVMFMQNKDLGFNKNQVLVMQDVRVVATDPKRTDLFRSELLKLKEVRAVSASSSTPGQVTWAAGYTPEGFEKDEVVSISTIYADHDFAKTYDLLTIEGRDLNRDFLSDSNAFLINEAAVEFFSTKDQSWSENPINKKIKSPSFEGRVMGVVKDFHLESPQQQIAPLIIQIDQDSFFNIQMKIQANDMSSVLGSVESTWKKLFPDLPFTYNFVDQEFSRLFESDQRLSRILRVFAVFSVAIAIMGLFGLASFQSYEKAKEMAIRKAVGATEKQLFALLTWNFLKLIFLAYLIALPLSFYIMGDWLNTFAYRINFPISAPIISLILIVSITILTVFYHTLKTSRVSPVEVLANNE